MNNEETNHKVVFPLPPGVVSPTFIASADLHLGKKLYNEPELEEDLRENLARLVDMAIELKVRYVVIAGDLFEDNSAKPHTIAFVSQQVQRLENNHIRMVGIAGDHDKPLKGEAWYRIAGLLPVSLIPEFAGVDYFDYSSVKPEELMELLVQDKDCSKVQWLFLHCQFPQLFEMAEPKKLIDVNHLNIFEHFPNLQGVIAGDLHFGPESKTYGVGHEAYLGYPGSLGQTAISEGAEPRRVLYCDGTALKSIPFPQRRKMIRIDFRDEGITKFNINEYLALCREERYKPVFYIVWDRNSEKDMHKVFPLYDVSLVHPYQVPVGSTLSTIDNTADRAEVSTEVKIEKALRGCCDAKDEELIKLSLNLITSEDPKNILDEFKSKFNL